MQTRQTIGPWLVTYTWDLERSQLGPVRVIIEPAEGADPTAVAAGVSTTVLREVHPVRPKVSTPEAGYMVGLGTRLRRLSKAGNITDEYLAALAAAYVTLAPAIKSPADEIAGSLGKGLSTVKNHLVLARKRGFLTTIPHRRGGVLTPAGEAALRKTSE